MTALVHEFLNGLQVGVSPADEGFSNTEHRSGCFVQLDEDSVVDLLQTKKLHDLLWLWWDLVNTTDANNESQLRLLGHVVVASSAGHTVKADLILLLLAVLLHVVFGSLELSLALFLGLLYIQKARHLVRIFIYSKIANEPSLC